MMKRFVGICAALLMTLVLAGCGQQTTTSTTDSSPAIDQLASCLTANGTTFYGTEWCSHCKDQKKLFGSALSKINYVDCDKNSPACASAGVRGYPTWVFADGSQLVGTQQLDTLASKAGCIFTSETLVAKQQQEAIDDASIASGEGVVK